ncbi:unnamed protein product, partial [Porites evermanni]
SKSHCTACNRALSCAKQGIKDVKDHLETKAHQNNAKQLQKQPTLFQTCASTQNDIDKVPQLCLYLYMYYLIHDLCTWPAVDTFNSLFKDIFPDSKIGKAYASGRTKTTCIVNGALKPYFR